MHQTQNKPLPVSLWKSGALDIAHLERVTLGNLEVARAALALFDRQAPQLMSEIQSTASLTRAAALAHKLKGSAQAIGAWKVAVASEDIERAAAVGKSGVLQRDIRRLAARIEETRTAIAVQLS